jgi:hypothetical protein
MYVLIIPYTVMVLPLFFFPKKSEVRKDGGIIGSSIIGVGIYACVFLVLSMLITITTVWFVNLSDSWGEVPLIYRVGIMCWFFGFIVGVAVLIKNGVDALGRYMKKVKRKRYEDWRNNGMKDKINTDNLLVSFIKATYHKYCPKITWLNDPDKKSFDIDETIN